jgi:hydrogenase maturation protease
MSRGSVLVAGVGNYFMGDDAFGIEVVHRLAERSLPNHVRVVDFGIRGLDLAYALLEPHDLVVLVDAAARGGAPGTLYLIEPELAALSPGGSADTPSPLIEGHSLVPAQVLLLVHALGGQLRNLVILGCEPAAIPDVADMSVGLSPPVTKAVDAALGVLERLIETGHA